VNVIKILGEGSIGAGMRRVDAITGPEALRAINADRALLDDVVQALRTSDRTGAPARIRELIEENRRLRAELGRLAKQDAEARAHELAGRATSVAGVRLVATTEDGDAGALRDLAQRAVGRLENESGAAVVLGSAADGKALVVAACSGNLVARGVPAPALLEPVGKAIGGNAGGKPILAIAGGPKAEAVADAVRTLVPARLQELLGGS
jgi:alanyl-tRNA synthetase